MSDPKRHKDLVEVFVGEAKYKIGDNETPIELYALTDKKVIEEMPREAMEKIVRDDIAKLSPTPVSGINQLNLLYNFTDPDALKDFDFGNILVQANLPYCIHVPNFYEMKVSIPERNLKALVTFEKIWTNRSRADGKKSDTVDFYAENQVLYFKDSAIISPVTPFRPKEGWDSFFTATNAEKMKDQNGVFRYTRVHIQFEMDLENQSLLREEKANEDLLEKVRENATEIINRVIDNYRDVTNEVHIRRLGDLKINLIYFIPQNKGFYLLSPNIETAKMNRSRKEILATADLLSEGKRPEVYKLLLMDARSSFDTKDYTLAIVESFQALEILLEDYLVQVLKDRGDTEEQWKKVLKINWQTKDRLTTLFKELKRVSLNERPEIWDKWCIRYDKTRNEVLHAGKEPTEKETSETLEINETVVDWIKSIS